VYLFLIVLPLWYLFFELNAGGSYQQLTRTSRANLPSPLQVPAQQQNSSRKVATEAWKGMEATPTAAAVHVHAGAWKGLEATPPGAVDQATEVFPACKNDMRIKKSYTQGNTNTLYSNKLQCFRHLSSIRVVLIFNFTPALVFPGCKNDMRIKIS